MVNQPQPTAREYTPAEKQVMSLIDEGEWKQAIPLIRSGAVSINLQDPDGRTLLSRAIVTGRIEATGWLIENHADHTIPDKLGWLPIHHASNNAYGFFLEMLLQAGAKPDVPTDGNSQPIHFAGWVSAHNVEMLLDAGASLFATDKDGKTVAHIATVSEDQQVQGVVNRYLAHPKLDDANTPINKKILTLRNRQGFCLLDNPDTWHRFDEVQARLAANGETLGLEDLLQTNAAGKPWLARAAECRVFPHVLNALNAQDQTLGKDALVNADGKATPLLDVLCAKGAIRHVLQPGNWRDSLRDLRDVYAAMPTRGKAQIPNWHTLQAWTARANAQQENLRRVG